MTLEMGGGLFISILFSIEKFALLPGSMRLANNKAKVIAIKVENKYKKMDFPPILPKDAVSSKLVTPLTIEKKTTGTISIFKEEINKLPKTSTELIKSLIVSGIKKFIKLPKNIPKSKEINILLVNVIILI